MAKQKIDIHLTEDQLRLMLKKNTKAEIIDDVILLVGMCSKQVETNKALADNIQERTVLLNLQEKKAEDLLAANMAYAKAVYSQEKSIAVLISVVERLLKDSS